jgi:hypothetical protein
LKPNQLLKYLNKGSAHTPATFISIQHGVLRRLASLTSTNQDTEDVPMNDLYKGHCRALVPSLYPIPF